MSAITVSTFSASGGSSLWSLIHQLQLLMLFLMIPTYIAKDVIVFLEANDFILFTFDFIPSTEMPFVKKICDWMDSEQTLEALENLGLGSKSTFVNLFSLLTTTVGIAALHF